MAQEKYYTLTYVGDYASLNTTVSALDQDQAILRGCEMIESFYGLDISNWRVEDIEERD